MFSRLSGCQRCCRTFQTNLSSFSRLPFVWWYGSEKVKALVVTKETLSYSSSINKVHCAIRFFFNIFLRTRASLLYLRDNQQQEEETEDYEEETFCGGLVVEQWTEPPTLKCRHLFVFKFSSSSGKSEFVFPGYFFSGNNSGDNLPSASVQRCLLSALCKSTTAENLRKSSWKRPSRVEI